MRSSARMHSPTGIGASIGNCCHRSSTSSGKPTAAARRSVVGSEGRAKVTAAATASTRAVLSRSTTDATVSTVKASASDAVTSCRMRTCASACRDTSYRRARYSAWAAWSAMASAIARSAVVSRVVVWKPKKAAPKRLGVEQHRHAEHLLAGHHAGSAPAPGTPPPWPAATCTSARAGGSCRSPEPVHRAPAGRTRSGALRDSRRTRAARGDRRSRRRQRPRRRGERPDPGCSGPRRHPAASPRPPAEP